MNVKSKKSTSKRTNSKQLVHILYLLVSHYFMHLKFEFTRNIMTALIFIEVNIYYTVKKIFYSMKRGVCKLFKRIC